MGDHYVDSNATKTFPIKGEFDDYIMLVEVRDFPGKEFGVVHSQGS